MVANGTAVPDERDLHDALDSLGNGRGKIIGCCQDVVNAIEPVWDWLPPPAKLWINDKLRFIWRKVQELLEKVDDILRRSTPLISAVRAAVAWSHRVAPAIPGMIRDITYPEDENFAKWSGGAATAYVMKRDGQRAAVNAILDNSKFARDWLIAMVQTNLKYITGVMRIVVDVISDLTAAAIDAAEIIDIPWALDEASKSIGDVVSGMGQMLLTIPSDFIAAMKDATKLDDLIDASVAFPGGQWPQAVSDG